MGVIRNAYKILARRPYGKRPRRIWEENITMDLRETGYDDVGWIKLS